MCKSFVEVRFQPGSGIEDLTRHRKKPKKGSTGRIIITKSEASPGHGLFWRSNWEDRAGTGQLIFSFNGLVRCIVQLLLKIFHVSVDFCLTAIFKKQNWKKQSRSPSPRAPSPAHWLSPTANGLVFPLLLVFNSTKKGFAVQGFFFCEQVVIKLRLCILWAASALAPSGQCGGSTRKGLGKVESANSTSNLIPSIS